MAYAYAGGSKTATHLQRNGPGHSFGGRFSVLDILRSGNDVNTYLGEDRQSGQKVVIKTLPGDAVSAAAVAHLEHEAQVLSTLNSPYVAPVVHLGLDDGSLYLVMPFVDGITLKERLGAEPFAVGDALVVGLCLMEALQQVHDLGIVHGDIKSSNVIVSAGLEVEKAVLIDCGLARSAHLQTTMRDQAAGTVRYMSPEMAGLIEQNIDERSDLYSAGILLFEVIAGRPPFDAETIGEVLRQHLSAAPPELRSLGFEVPRALDAIIQRLLRKDPGDRYQSADAVRSDLDELLAGLKSGNADPSMIVGLHDRRRTLAEPSFVGRVSELVELKGLLAFAAKGEPQFALVSSQSGGGKTRLVSEFAKEIAQTGAWVLRGQGLDNAAQRPFQLLAGVALDLLAAQEREPGLIDNVLLRLGDEAKAVADAMPELSKMLKVRPTALGPEEHGEFRSIRGLARLLHSLGSPDRPAVIILDDCQWSDELSLKALAWWAGENDRAESGPSHTLIVGAFRSEEVGSDHPLKSMHVTADLELPVLADEDLRSLAESMAGPLPGPALEVVTSHSEGSPFMASAVLRGMVEADALRAEASGWTIDENAMADVSSSKRAAEFLARRLSLLYPRTLHILATAAILGKEFDLTLAATLSGTTLTEAFAAIHEARRRHIVWVNQQTGRSAFVHDKLRETVLASIDPSVRTEAHLNAALHIERYDPKNIFQSAYHFDAAGESKRALPYALEAAEQARSQHALEVAEDQYRIAERGVDENDVASKRLIAEGMGDTLMLRGRYADAEPYFAHALTLVEGRAERSKVLGKVGELAFKKGDVEAAEQAIETALRTLGKRVPNRMLGFVAQAAWETIVQAAHTLLPRLILNRRSFEGAESEFIALRLYSRLAHTYWFGRGTIPTLWAHLREMNLSEKYAPSPELAQAYSEHAPVMTLVTHFRRGIDYAKKSLAIRTSLGDVWGQGQSLHFYGIVLYGASRYKESIEKCREAIRLLERTGDRWEVNTATWHIALAQYRLGDLNAAVETAKRGYRAGEDIGDAQARGISLGAWSKASGGRVPRELLEAEMRLMGRDVHTGAEIMQAYGVKLLAEGEYAQAVDRFVEARTRILRAGVIQEYVAPIFPWLVTALRMQAEAAPVWATQERADLMRRARKASRWANRIASRYRNNRPHALREAGLVAAALGRQRRARRFLDRSLAVAEAQEAAYERAQTLLARGRVGLDLGWDDAAADAATAQALLSEMRPEEETHGPVRDPSGSVTPSLIDRFDNLLDVGRRIASSLTREAVLSTLHAGAITLLRGEYCTILSTTSGAEPVVVFGETDVASSRSLIHLALESGKPAVLADDPSGDASESLALKGIRSAICAPIYVRGNPEACFVVVHHEVRGLYKENEERIASFLASIAGAAIENADGFTEVKDLTRSLEMRVVERTTELRDANLQLEKANLAMKDFVSTASHDLRTPITAILGFTATLTKNWTSIGEAQRLEMLEVINRQSRQLSSMVDDLLTISYIESGVVEAHPEKVSIRLEIEQAIEPHALTADIEVVCPGELRAFVDLEHLRRILSNLVGNAVKYGEPPLKAEACAFGRWIEIRVCDRGPGIPEEFVERLFEKFARANTPATREQKGTGLGLSIVKGLAEANGGEVWFEANTPVGSCFGVKFPKDAETLAH